MVDESFIIELLADVARLEQRVDELEVETIGPPASKQLWFKIDGYLYVPIEDATFRYGGSDDSRSGFDPEVTPNPVVVYADDIRGNRWTVKHHERAHEGIDKKYGWWIGNIGNIEVVTYEDVPDE